MTSPLPVLDRQTTYLSFVRVADTGKTLVWEVRSVSASALLGRIGWFGRWRQYCFFPHPDTVFNRGCLDDINSFIADQMDRRKRGRSDDDAE